MSLAATDDYYLGEGEPPGFWLGKGAGALGLSGEIEKEDFRNLLRGFSPHGEKKLVRNADSERRAGWDLTWSAPKSVSVAWSQASPSVRHEIEKCLRKAVQAGISYLEAVAGFTRRGEDGWLRERAYLIFAAFQHSTSRAQDPQLHVHTVLLNVSVRLDGTTGTIEPREIYRHQMAAGALFRAELASALERELGLRAVREGRAFHLSGVDRGLIAAFSTRRAQIEAALSKRGLSGGKASEVAALDTREKKESVSREELFSRWHALGREHNWTAKELSLLLHAPLPARDREKDIDQVADLAIKKLTQTESHFAVRRLTQAVAEEAQGRNLNAKDVLRIRDGLLRSPELVSLGTHMGEEHWTTKEVLRLEQHLLRTCMEIGKQEELLPDAARYIDEAIKNHPELSTEQRAALRHVLEARGGLRVVNGMAGTGKSTLFRAAQESWAAQGFSVIGATLSGKAAVSLQESSQISSQTLHRVLCDIEQGDLLLTKSTVCLIDEAAMVGTRQLSSIADACLKANATLILCGDAKQLQAIELGGAFAEISSRFGTAELTEIRRQREDWAKAAVRDFAAGDSQRALFSYLERGLVSHSNEDKWSAMEKLVSEWSLEAPSLDKDLLILAGTNGEASALNHMAQEFRGTVGHLGKASLALGMEFFFEGDRVLFRRNSMALSVMNGDRGTVKKIEGQDLHVVLDSGRTARVDTNSYPHLSLGYALTTHKAQGMTVEKAFILVSEQMLDREMTYVQASRTRGETRWYLSGELPEVTRHMARSRKKQMASTIAPELELTLQL